ncbi:unnamed protein product [Cuscuta epithymum]|uniref:Uncharacterized protein n=1 Tax=Cuscuta epithymum TaxID=186058 RepID=A0AAV0CHS4_9ASTE|nr:unnamed protein product [Cuscuta epithymum]
MSPLPFLKTPKVESDARNEESIGGETHYDGGDAQASDTEPQPRSEQEEALVALIEHRTKEVTRLRQRVSYYKSQLNEAERRLDETQVKLGRLRGHDSSTISKSSYDNGMKNVKSNWRSSSPASCSEDTKNLAENKPQEKGISLRPLEQKSAGNQPQSKPQLVIPTVKPKAYQPTKMVKSEPKDVASSPGSFSSEPAFPHSNNMTKIKAGKSMSKSSEKEAVDAQSRGIKRKFEQKEQKNLVSVLRTSSSPNTIRCHTCSTMSSQHKRKLRSLVLCPTSEQLFATSALDGLVNLWQIQRGSTANLLSTTDCFSPKQRRWPEDIAWHPDGGAIFSAYGADKDETQISILNLNKTKESRISFLEAKPHVKGIINSIVFMPWEDICFVTGGSDHAVFCWTEIKEENMWKHKALHRSEHTSSVTGVAGMQHKKIVMSVGADKRIIGYDMQAGRAGYIHQIDSKCMSILPNPCDFNLFLVQAGTLEKQLRLFDIRAKQREVHAFGWKQESSDSQSALINQDWSPDGLYITSGSVDPVIHIFDIRYNSHKPSQSIKAHQKRVFKAVWHHTLPLLISISSDLNIGLHKVS